MNATQSLSELGGSLGRIAAVPGDDAGTPLPPIRLRFATTLFQAAGKARAALASNDRAEAAAALAPSVWHQAWEEAVGAVGEALAESVEADMRAAAAASRMPTRLLERRLLTGAERRALTARLGRGTGRITAGLKPLAAAADDWRAATGLEVEAAFRRWDDAVQTVARRAEAAWLVLRQEEVTETAHWRAETTAIAGWQRPRWPLWVISGAVVALAVYLGLITGGYLRAPGPLEILVDLWWDRP